MHHFARCLIHAGMPKTGTTTVQSLLSVNRRAFRARGVLYPACLGRRSHLQLAAALHPGPSPQLDSALEDTGAADRAALRLRLEEALDAEVAAACAEAAAAGRPPPHTLLLSSEFFWSLPRGAPMLQALRAFAGARATRCDVVLWLRRQDAFAVSLASTRARDGEVGGRPGQAMFPQRPRRAYRYDRCLSDMADAFGEDHVHPRIFEPEALRDGDILADAMAAFDIGPLDGLLRPPRRNAALRPAMQDWLNRLSEAHPDHYGRGATLRPALGPLIDRHEGPGLRPSAEEAAQFMAQFADENARVRARWFPGRDQLFAAPPDWPAQPDPLPDATALMEVTHTALMLKEAEIARLDARLALAEGRDGDALAFYARAAGFDPGAVDTAQGWADALLRPGMACPAGMIARVQAEIAHALTARPLQDRRADALRLAAARLSLLDGDAAAARDTAAEILSRRPEHPGAARLVAAARDTAQSAP